MKHRYLTIWLTYCISIAFYSISKKQASVLTCVILSLSSSTDVLMIAVCCVCVSADEFIYLCARALSRSISSLTRFG